MDQQLLIQTAPSIFNIGVNNHGIFSLKELLCVCQNGMCGFNQGYVIDEEDPNLTIVDQDYNGKPITSYVYHDRYAQHMDLLSENSVFRNEVGEDNSKNYFDDELVLQMTYSWDEDD